MIVLDSVGAGALPDADKYGDVGANTLGHIWEQAHPDSALYGKNGPWPDRRAGLSRAGENGGRVRPGHRGLRR
ncbi:MAG: hypothetical protein ACLUN6_03845 [Holdemanella sp.]|uniref:hypothetical protein n=1 Tax=Holdemanella sp. TaxID=1971762 RepID=UPI003992E105